MELATPRRKGRGLRVPQNLWDLLRPYGLTYRATKLGMVTCGERVSRRSAVFPSTVARLQRSQNSWDVPHTPTRRDKQ